jgi:hypothetical protein
MHTLRCVIAEWDVVRARLFHTRLGAWLLLLAAGLAWAARDDVSLAKLSVRTGLLAGVLCVAFAAGAQIDRASLRTTLGHPTTPIALATGRWLAATIAAALPVLGATLAGAVTVAAAPHTIIVSAVTGMAAAAAVAGGALPGVLLGGNTVAAAIAAYVVTLGMTPTRGSVLPNLGRYATPELGGILHAACWACGGVLLATLFLARRR